MDFKNILVAYDSSSFSNRAFKSALDVAESNKSKITIATVITGVYQPSIGFTMKYSEKMLEKYTKTLQKTFSNLESTAKKKSIKISLKILQDPSVAKAITNYVNSHKFDLVVIGSHGRTGLNKMILGSVANSVTQKVKCPVMVVK
ncbi:MAG: universal stress protein [Nitrosopumilus sp.]|nr:universal stress protein [Nitrosopumilus sp.]MDH3794995.1 universal stress protein [Nitrosopumilus sp.]MDH3855623.1 universal stress protein [Nitrosopumilus sp.]